MGESFDLSQYLRYLQRRWRWVAVACVSAAAVAVGITLLTPNRYTAMSRLVIEPPAGSDVRTPQVVTPQYLELLRTYEHVAGSDSLFQQALDRFGLRAEAPGRPVETWKRRILQVELVRNTKVLEIAVTLRDPKKAHAMAQYLAEQTIEMSRTLNRESDDELIKEAETERNHAQEEYERAQKEWSRISQAEPVDTLEAEIHALESRRWQIERALVDAEVQSAGAAGSPSGQEAKAQVSLMQAERKTVQAATEKTTGLLAQRKDRRRQADDERRAAQTRYESAQRRYEEVRGSAGYRGERLRLIDPGIVPERPSSPNLLLNVMSAVLFALAVSVGYLSLRFGSRRLPLDD